jgi:hypothetical protein
VSPRRTYDPPCSVDAIGLLRPTTRSPRCCPWALALRSSSGFSAAVPEVLASGALVRNAPARKQLSRIDDKQERLPALDSSFRSARQSGGARRSRLHIFYGPVRPRSCLPSARKRRRHHPGRQACTAASLFPMLQGEQLLFPTRLRAESTPRLIIGRKRAALGIEDLSACTVQPWAPMRRAHGARAAMSGKS